MTLSNPAKASIIDNFKSLGVNFVSGDVYDRESLVKAIKQVDVVISTVGYLLLADQVKIIDAIKEAGNIKVLPLGVWCGCGHVDRTSAVEPAKSTFVIKSQIRRSVEAAGIPYTYVSSNNFAGYFLPSFSQPGATAPPRDKVVILGDGNATAVYNKEDDIGTYTIRAVDDPRTLNKILYIKPADSPPPVNVILAIGHAVFVRGDQTNFEIEPSFGVEASELYPDVKYTSVDLKHLGNQFSKVYIFSRCKCFFYLIIKQKTMKKKNELRDHISQLSLLMLRM
uniref:NmrA-like domain-containing protein n=1 Tax=Chenopodium quinoa TaxID=63459 RepID=A0A803LDP6_CHEQI